MTRQEKLTYQCWQSMKTRCYNPNSQQYRNYGGRGITVCKSWLESYGNFLGDMGQKPDGLELDRENNNGNYEPTNCRWATRQQQRANQRDCVYIKFRGERLPRALMAKKYGFDPKTIWFRLVRSNWSVEQALTTPINVNLSPAHRAELAKLNQEGGE